MEVCGTHTSSIFKSGIRSLLSPKIKLVSGPGCPVCVTVPDYIDRCIEIAKRPDYEIICFGDLLKIPGSRRTLSEAKSAGGRIRMAWSPFDTLTLAAENPETTFVVAAIGFETTAPAFALLLEEAIEQGIKNIRLITSLKSALAAMDWICASGENIDAFLCPGHVSVVTGGDVYKPLAERYGKPFIIAGFEGEHLLSAIRAAAKDAAEGRSGVRNLYPEAVRAEGNLKARKITDQYFGLEDDIWRGLGPVARSGYYLREAYHIYDMRDCFDHRDAADVQSAMTNSSPPLRNAGILSGAERSEGIPDGCRCGEVILGRIDPDECPLFGTSCKPAHAAGPCMVSSEGACGTWYRSCI